MTDENDDKLTTFRKQDGTEVQGRIIASGLTEEEMLKIMFPNVDKIALTEDGYWYIPKDAD